MAQIRTIDNERHNVKENLDEITSLINNANRNGYSMVKLNWQVKITSWGKGHEVDRYPYEPCYFVISNIMFYY